MNNGISLYPTGETKIPQADFDNSNDNTIKVSEHKLRNYFQKFMKTPRLSSVAWSLGSSGTWFLAAATGNFNDFLGVEGSGVALHLILYCGSAVFLLVAVVLFIYWLMKGRDKSEDDFIELVKNGEVKKKRRWRNMKKWFKKVRQKRAVRQKV